MEGSPRPELSTKRYSRIPSGHLRQRLDKLELEAGAEDGAPVDLHHLDVIIAEDVAVDPQLAEFVLNDADAAALERVQEAEEKGGLSGAEKTGEYIELGALFGLHGGISFQSGAWGGGDCGGRLQRIHQAADGLADAVERVPVQGVVGPAAPLLRDGKACAAQELHIMGEGGLCDGEGLQDLAGAQGLLGEHGENLQPLGVGQRLAYFGQFLIGHTRPSSHLNK